MSEATPLQEPTAPPADAVRAGNMVIPPGSLAWKALDELSAACQDVQTLQLAMVNLKKQRKFKEIDRLAPHLEKARVRLGTATVLLADGWRAAVDEWRNAHGN